jgi:hypothetical protein
MSSACDDEPDRATRGMLPAISGIARGAGLVSVIPPRAHLLSDMRFHVN